MKEMIDKGDSMYQLVVMSMVKTHWNTGTTVQ